MTLIAKIRHLLINQPVVADQRNLWFGDVRSLKPSKYHKFSIIPGWSHYSPSLSCLHWHPSIPRGSRTTAEKKQYPLNSTGILFLLSHKIVYFNKQDSRMVPNYVLLCSIMFLHFNPHFPFLPETRVYTPRPDARGHVTSPPPWQLHVVLRARSRSRPPV